MSTGRILLTGATGFIGSTVLQELTRTTAAPVRALVRRPVATAPGPAPEFVRGDLTAPQSLHGICTGVDTVLHLASYVGSDEETCEAVNAAGTRALLAEAHRAGVRRILYVSTTAVLGAGPHRGLAEDAPAHPVSPASRTRLAAEQAVLAAGGTVLRPPLVYGRGDTWVVPAIAELTERVPALIDGGRALLSLVAVDDLARLVVAVAGTDAVPAGVHHAAHPEPVAFRDLLDALVTHAGLRAPVDDLGRQEYLARLRRTSGRVSEHQVSLIAADRWYASRRIWELAGCAPGPGLRIAEHADWYRAHLAGRARPYDNAA
ncbi:NAD-dependent epimerase/dehydratase family protein [Streptomyces sp. NPDC049555]|uniref:NAD-dependent epimerase/dehydratase family protein n=1 Tax=Streptomyces sp. NPDC049555 TaxID=3154930 RepID=UPI003443F466